MYKYTIYLSSDDVGKYQTVSVKFGVIQPEAIAIIISIMNKEISVFAPFVGTLTQVCSILRYLLLQNSYYQAEDVAAFITRYGGRVFLYDVYRPSFSSILVYVYALG